MTGPPATTSRIARLALVASGVVVLTPRATGQTVSYNLIVQNLTQGTPRGTLISGNVGDVLRVWVSADHNGLSLGAAGFTLELRNFQPLPLTEPSTAGFDLTDNLVGRHPHMRNTGSDGAPGASGARDIVINDLGFNHWSMTDNTGDWIDLVTLPPTTNPLIGLFPIGSGEQFFAFDVLLAPRMGRGGIYSIELHHNPSARLFRNSTDGVGVPTAAVCGQCFLWVPAPATLALFPLAIVAGQRRRG